MNNDGLEGVMDLLGGEGMTDFNSTPTIDNELNSYFPSGLESLDSKKAYLIIANKYKEKDFDKTTYTRIMLKIKSFYVSEDFMNGLDDFKG